ILKNEQTYYTISYGLGSPAQPFRGLVDTGSADIWVMGTDNPSCKENSPTGTYSCANAGIFNKATSSTFNTGVDSPNFDLSYNDGTAVSGTYGKDTMTLSGASIPGVQFAVASRSSSSLAVFGVGPQYLESSYYLYDNLPIVLANSKMINSQAYSLYLNGRETTGASILFGGVDSAKYTGGLYTIPMVSRYNGYPTPPEFTIALNSISYTVGGTETVAAARPMIALLDSGTSLMYLPSDIVNKIATAYSATYTSSVGAYVYDCGTSAKSDNFLTFTFSGVEMNIPLQVASLPYSGNRCILGMSQTSSDNNIILGDTFLRAVYTVFDLTNSQVAMAQSINGATSSSVEEITADLIPGAVPYSDFKGSRKNVAIISS
ncbi:acid protease, partial [Nadsonia fulvescens var. elongata DSM 6958]